jgi:hypothetical protein
MIIPIKKHGIVVLGYTEETWNEEVSDISIIGSLVNIADLLFSYKSINANSFFKSI